jgi:hypothetical protein
MGVEAATLTRDEQDSASPRPRADAGGLARLAPVLAAAAAVVPILVAAIRAYSRGWIPYGDDAYFTVRAWDVFSRDVPLLGTYSSATGRVAGYAINHPGPLQFDLLAVPVRVLGHDLGTAVGQALINATAVALVAWLTNRLLGRTGSTLAMAGSALLVLSMGSEVLYRPWGPYAAVLPFLLLLVAVWCSLADDPVALPVTAVAGSYCLETHLSYSLLVPGLVLLTAGWTILRLVRPTQTSPDEARKRATRRWGAVALVAGAVCWIQPVFQQFTAPGMGNLSAIAHSAGNSVGTPGLEMSIRRLAQTVALPPAWLPPTFSEPPTPLDPPPSLASAGLALALLVAATAILGWRAARRGSQAIAAGCATSLVAITLALATLPRMPTYADGMPIHQLMWLWPLGLVAWLVIAAATVDELAARDVRPRLLVGAALAIAVVAGAAALPTRAGIHEPFAWAVPGVRAVEDDVVEAVRGKGPILVDMPYSTSTSLIGPALLPVLQREGIPFLVRDDGYVQTLGERRRYEPGDATWRLTITGQLNAQPPGLDDRLVARWTDLPSGQGRELDRLTGELRSALVATGLPLVPGAADRLRDAGFTDMVALADNARSDPEAVLNGEVFLVLDAVLPAIWSEPIIDPDRFPVELIPRWIELTDGSQNRTISIYLGPIEA